MTSFRATKVKYQKYYAENLMPKIENAKEISILLPSPAKKYYRHGWQSWSLATWQDAEQKIAIPKPSILHPMQYDPAYIHEKRPHGSSLGAVKMENGKILLLGALDFDAHVFLDGDNSLVNTKMKPENG